MLCTKKNIRNLFYFDKWHTHNSKKVWKCTSWWWTQSTPDMQLETLRSASMATGCDSTASTPSVRLREASSSLLSLEENRTKRMLRRTHTISLVLSTQKGFACSSRPPHHEREVTLLIYQHLSAIIEHAPLETLAARTVLPMLSDAGRVLWSGHLRYRRAFSCSAVSNLQRTGPPGDARPALCKIRRPGRTINCP